MTTLATRQRPTASAQSKLRVRAAQRPFDDETELRRLINRCHDRILFQTGHDPAKAFDEISQLLMVKLFDEQHHPERTTFARMPGEPPAEVAQRIRALLHTCAGDVRFGPVVENTFEGGIRGSGIDLDDDTIAFVVESLEDFSLSATGDLLHGADVKGVVFETMVGSTFRGNLGAYFTPRNIAEFMVYLLDPTPDVRVFDPACGSGGFLIMILKYLRERLQDHTHGPERLFPFAQENLTGFDINERMVRIARMNLVMHGAPADGIHRANGLALHRDPCQVGRFDLCLANPPFAGFESDPGILAEFEVSETTAGHRSVNKVLPFIEQIIRLLRPGGRAGIVVPISVLNAEAEVFVRLRELLFRDTRLIAIVGLTQAAFHHTDCGSHGALLFFERLPSDGGIGDYEVFVDFADNVGYNRLGHAISGNELPDILARYIGRDKSRLISVSQLRDAGRIDPTWWRPSNQAFRKRLAGARDMISIASLYEVRRELVTKRQLAGKTWRFFQVRDADLVTGDIQDVHESGADELPGRIRQVVHAGDVLLPNHRDSLIAKKATGGRSAVIVPPHLDGVLTTNRFFVLVPKVPAVVLRSLLNSPFVRQQLTMQARGGASLDITEEALANVSIPRLGDGGSQLAREIEIAEEHVTALRAELALAERRARELVTEVLGCG